MSELSQPPSQPPAGAVTVRGLAPDLKARLRVRAAHNARSMEAEARAILEAALTAPEEDPTDLAAFARGLFAPLGGVELELPTREPARDPPAFTGEEGAADSSGAAAPRTVRSVAAGTGATAGGPKAPPTARSRRR